MALCSLTSDYTGLYILLCGRIYERPPGSHKGIEARKRAFFKVSPGQFEIPVNSFPPQKLQPGAVRGVQGRRVARAVATSVSESLTQVLRWAYW